MSLARTLTKWLAPAAALFALACALLAPAEAGSPRRMRAQDANVRGESKTAEPEDSNVHGRVVYDETSRPARRARVVLITDGGGRTEYAALTDGRGDFQIKGVRAGTYYAFVDLPGVLSPIGFISVDDIRATAGTLQLGEGRKYFDRIEVDGKQDVTVTVHARRGGSISGRVTYADGDPAVNVNISLMRRDADGRARKYLTGATMASFAGMRTDDRGMFRLMGLPPGEYLIGAYETVNHGADAGGAGDQSDDAVSTFRGIFTQPLLMTFYPSATSLKEAGSIKVDAGDERADVDITIPERELRTINGIVRARRGGRPVAHARVALTRRDDSLATVAAVAAYYDPSELGSNVTLTDEAGRWQFKEIPDGAYIVHVKPPDESEESPAELSSLNVAPPAVVVGDVNTVTNMNTSAYRPPRHKRPFAPTHRDLEVSGGDVSEFVVEVADGGHIAGTVSVEGDAPPRYGYISLVRVSDSAAAPEDAGSLPSGSIDGGQFVIEGLPAGKFFLHPGLGADRNVYLKSISWNGKDLLRQPLELGEGASVEGVRIVFSRNPAKLNVIVRAAGKQPPNDIIVYLLPADLSAWVPDSRPIFCMTDAGACIINAPPGEYRVVAIRRTGLPGAYEQEVRRRAATSPRVTLREGETSRVELEPLDN